MLPWACMLHIASSFLGFEVCSFQIISQKCSLSAATPPSNKSRKLHRTWKQESYDGSMKHTINPFFMVAYKPTSRLHCTLSSDVPLDVITCILMYRVPQTLDVLWVANCHLRISYVPFSSPLWFFITYYLLMYSTPCVFFTPLLSSFCLFVLGEYVADIYYIIVFTKSWNHEIIWLVLILLILYINVICI